MSGILWRNGPLPVLLHSRHSSDSLSIISEMRRNLYRRLSSGAVLMPQVPCFILFHTTTGEGADDGDEESLNCGPLQFLRRSDAVTMDNGGAR